MFRHPPEFARMPAVIPAAAPTRRSLGVFRVAFVIPTLDQSGAERQLTMLACGLPRDQVQSHVFALDRGGGYEQALQQAGIPVQILHKRRRFDPAATLRLRSALRTYQPDIIQSFLFSANTLIRLPGIAPTSAKLIVSERCVDSWKSPWQLWLDRRLARRAHSLTANSLSVAAFYRNLGVPAERITVIPNGIATATATHSRLSARQTLGLRSSAFVIGFIGRLAPQKRLHDLIWAFQLLHQVIEDSQLVLIGGGPDEPRLRKLLAGFDCGSKVVFAGHRADAAQLLPALDAFVLPSEFEGMSNSLMEAMAAGIPCAVSNIDANRELIRDGETGSLFPLGSGPEIARCLLRFQRNPEHAAMLAAQAAEFVRNELSSEQMIRRHLDLYRSLLNR